MKTIVLVLILCVVVANAGVFDWFKPRPKNITRTNYTQHTPMPAVRRANNTRYQPMPVVRRINNTHNQPMPSVNHNRTYQRPSLRPIVRPNSTYHRPMSVMRPDSTYQRPHSRPIVKVNGTQIRLNPISNLNKKIRMNFIRRSLELSLIQKIANRTRRVNQTQKCNHTKFWNSTNFWARNKLWNNTKFWNNPKIWSQIRKHTNLPFPWNNTKKANHTERWNKTKKANHTEKWNKTKKANHTERWNKTKKADRIERWNKTKKANHTERWNKTKKADRIERWNKTKKANHTERWNKTKKANHTEKCNKTKKANHTEKQNKTKKANHTKRQDSERYHNKRMQRKLEYGYDDIHVCLNSTKDFYLVIQAFEAHLNATTRDPNVLVDDISGIIKHVSKTLEQCGLAIVKEKIQNVLPDQCVDDLNGTTKTGIKIMNEINNIIQVIADLPVLIANLKKAKATCPFLKPHNATLF